MSLAPDDPRHGTLRGYNGLGCRCAKCREASRLYMREFRAASADRRRYDQLQRTAYRNAERRLRLAHRAEFQRYYDESYEALIYERKAAS